MKFFLLSMIVVLPLFAVKLVDYNIYDRNDRVDIMLSFDNVYSGKISQTKNKNLTLLTFSDLDFNKDELKKINSKLVSKISISSKNNNTYIMLQNNQDVSLNISSINDKFGIRIRAVEFGKENLKSNISELAKKDEKNPSDSLFDLKNTNQTKYDYTNYILVMLILIALLIVLWWLKRSIFFQKNGISRDFRIIFQRFLDKNNQLMVFEYANKRYTMIIGNSNIVLENTEISEQDYKVSDTIVKKEKNFDSFFEENKKRIQNLIEQRQKN
ncbi:hypothetical protein CQA69_03335 [Campylobacter estrildidarum]|uniref:Excinuclease ABC subunit A n=1 Tax=Campylobacter estrildidarum TaxID=2510189 RepID=A0A4U7BHK1_9BACT|nr:hypothetical protein [Campylobacter estrildidarum]TKX31288.1 hypothetical protein CQA69_03335 [Campylobacter estrildidarum]